MKRREFLGGVAAGVATVLMPLPNLGPIEAATEVVACQSAFQKQFMAEFLQQYQQQGILMSTLNPPDRQWFNLEADND